MNIYAIQSESGPIKIGVSIDPARRLKALTTHKLFSAEIVHTTRAPDGKAYAIEAAAHALLRAKRHRGEWFNITKEQAIEAIELAIDAVDRGESVKKMLRRIEHRPAKIMPEDAVRRLMGKIGNKLTWRDVEEITTFSTATLRRHYL